MKYGELFAGAGGMSLGLERAGLSCAFHAEIADFPRRVLSHRWPDTPLYGDVSTLDGRELVAKHGAIDLLAGGSPCQDMSVAGKRAGLDGSRSVLFYEQIRLWEETGATYILWENVAGALSSNRGADFAQVLSAIVGAPVPVPSAGWPRGGVVAGPTGVAAWRLLDAQYFGVPQRRLRVFVLGARAGGCDPAEVLLEPQGVRGNPPTRREAGERIAPDAGERAASPCCSYQLDTCNQSGCAARARGSLGFQSSQSGVRQVEQFATLDANYGSRRHNGVLSWDDECNAGEEIIGTLPAKANSGQSRAGVVSFGWQNSEAQGDDVSQGSDAPLRTGTTPAVLAFDALNQSVNREACDTLRGEEGMTGGGWGGILAYDTTQVTSQANRSNPRAGDTDHPLAAQAHAPLVVSYALGIPRRLMPVECERLMGWHDGWTDVPDPKTGKPASDAQRYKACGNGVVSPVAEWIAARLLAVHSAMLDESQEVAA